MTGDSSGMCLARSHDALGVSLSLVGSSCKTRESFCAESCPRSVRRLLGVERVSRAVLSRLPITISARNVLPRRPCYEFDTFPHDTAPTRPSYTCVWPAWILGLCLGSEQCVADCTRQQAHEDGDKQLSHLSATILGTAPGSVDAARAFHSAARPSGFGVGASVVLCVRPALSRGCFFDTCLGMDGREKTGLWLTYISLLPPAVLNPCVQGKGRQRIQRGRYSTGATVQISQRITAGSPIHPRSRMGVVSQPTFSCPQQNCNTDTAAEHHLPSDRLTHPAAATRSHPSAVSLQYSRASSSARSGTTGQDMEGPRLFQDEPSICRPSESVRSRICRLFGWLGQATASTGQPREFHAKAAVYVPTHAASDFLMNATPRSMAKANEVL